MSVLLLHYNYSSGNGNGGLRAGISQIWLCTISTSFDIDYFGMVATSPPSAYDAYEGAPAIVPGMVQAERFDWGGEGVGYSDSTLLNVWRVSGSG